MNFLSKLEDKFIDGWLFVFPPQTEADKKTVTLHFDFLIPLLLASFVGSTISSSVQRRKLRKSQEKMANKARRQQADADKAMENAQRDSRTPLPPKDQELRTQAQPLAAASTKGSLGIRGAKRGKAKLRIGSGSRSVGARYA